MMNTKRLKGFGLALLLPSLLAYADTSQPLLDGGFESQTSQDISAPWSVEGSGFKGIDVNKGLAASGKNNAFIRTAPHEWNAITQFINIDPSKEYGVSATIRTSDNVRDGYFGVRDWQGGIIKEVKFGPLPQYTTLRFFFRAPRQTGVKVYVGYWALGEDSWIQIDDVHVGAALNFDDAQ
jgi:hypothetical protein